MVDGFPDRSAILIIGPPGIGKEAVCYWSIHSSILQGDMAVYVSRHSVQEVLEDARGYGVKLEERVTWVDCSGHSAPDNAITCRLGDLTELSVTLKKLVAENASRRIRIVMDVLSPLLLLNPLENMYKFFSSLLVELKKYDTVLIATVEEGMHTTREVVAFEGLFDGVIEMRLYEQMLQVLPLLQVKKMRGLSIQPAFHNFRFSSIGGMEISAYSH